MRAVLSATDIKVAYIFTDWRMWLYLWDLVEASGLGDPEYDRLEQESTGNG